MDDYPDQLAPHRDAEDDVSEPFEHWWRRVRAFFPTVPRVVARDWLYEHWRNSPFDFLRSANYAFRPVAWPSDCFHQIRSRLNDYAEDHHELLEDGAFGLAGQMSRDLSEADLRGSLGTPRFMLEHGDFPSPIILLDNRDGHLQLEYRAARLEPGLSNTFILVEGHRRFNYALALQRDRRLKPLVSVYLMERQAARALAPYSRPERADPSHS